MKSEVRSQESGVRRKNSEGRIRNSEFRIQNSEVVTLGSPAWLEISNGRSPVAEALEATDKITPVTLSSPAEPDVSKGKSPVAEAPEATTHSFPLHRRGLGGGFIYSVILSTLYLLAVPLYSQPALTLQEAIRKSQTAHESVQSEILKEQSASLAGDQAFNNRLPTVKATGRLTRQSEVDPFRFSLDLPAPVGTINRTISESVEDVAAFRLTVNQPLFTGFKLPALQDAAEWNEKAASMDVQTRKQELAVHVTRAYGAVVVAEKQFELTRNLLKVLEKRLADAESMFNQGMITEPDVLSIRVKMTETEAELIYSEDRVKLARLSLGQWMGEPSGIQLALAPPQIPPVASQPGKRPELAGLEFRQSAAEEMKKVAGSDWFPAIALQANLDYANPNSRYFPIEQKWHSSWDVSLVFSYDLWTWSNRSIQNEQAEINLSQIKLQQSSLEKAITLEQQSADASVEKSQKLVTVMTLLVEQTDKKAAQFSRQYEAGLINITDLLDAETQAFQARVQLELARVNLVTDQVIQARAYGKVIQ